MPLSLEDIIFEYFRLMENKDLDRLLDLFAYDAVVYEPFSTSAGGLRGRSAIEPFLKVAMMANTTLHRKIEIKKSEEDKIVAQITFEKGDKVKGTFTFEFEPGEDLRQKKIKMLRIQFL